MTCCARLRRRLWRHFDNWLPPFGAPDRVRHHLQHPSHQLIALLQFLPPTHSPEVHSHYPCSKEGKPEETEPCTSTDDDSCLAGQEQVVAPGLATPPNNAGEDPILDPDSDSSLAVQDNSGGAAAKSDSKTKNNKDTGEWPKYMNGSVRDMLVQAGPHQDKDGNFPRDELQRKFSVAHYNRRMANRERPRCARRRAEGEVGVETGTCEDVRFSYRRECVDNRLKTGVAVCWFAFPFWPWPLGQQLSLFLLRCCFCVGRYPLLKLFCLVKEDLFF
nr:unnamed protein product [Salmo salar]|eukprot:XP_014064712.1 PREDICTED: uncharacterized protein LOC106610065 [Salmo salar]